MNARVFITYCLALILFTLFFSFIYPANDIVWLMHCAHLMLAGKSNYIDYFETNPPLIIWFNIPAVFIGYLFKLPDYMAYYIWVLCLITVFLYWIYQLFTRYFSSDKIIGMMISALIVAFILLPMNALGERDVLSLFLVFPYLMLMVLRLSQKKVSWNEAGLAAACAAIGVSFKPYFLCVVILVEGFYFCQRQSIRAYCTRPEPLVMFVSMLIYLGAVFLLEPNYFRYVFPLVRQLYIPAFAKLPPMNSMFSLPGLSLLIGLILMLMYSVTRTKDYFFHVMLLAAIGFYVAYVIPGQQWYYHAYPSMALVLMGLFYIGLQLAPLLTHWKPILYFQAIILSFLFIVSILMLSFEYEIADYAKYNSTLLVNQLISYLRHQKIHSPILMIDDWIDSAPIMHALPASMTSRFPSMLLLPGLKKLEIEHQLHRQAVLKTLFFNMMMSDIQKRPPAIVIFAEPSYYLYSPKLHDMKAYSMKQFFESSTRFRAFFKHYVLVKKIHSIMIYIKPTEKEN